MDIKWKTVTILFYSLVVRSTYGL